MEQERSPTNCAQYRINQTTPDRKGRGSNRGQAQGRQRGKGARRAVHTATAEVQDEGPGESVDVVGTRIQGELPVLWKSISIERRNRIRIEKKSRTILKQKRGEDQSHEA